MAARRAKQPPEIIEQSIRVTPDLEVVIRAPRSAWPHIAWNGPNVEIVAFGERKDPFAGIARPEPANFRQEPPQDTPEVAAARAALESRFPRKADGSEAKPFTMADVARENSLGIDLSEDNLMRLVAPIDSE